MGGAIRQIDLSVFDSHEDFGDKLGLGGVKTTEVATYQTCNWLILLSRGIICKYAVSRLNAMILFSCRSPAWLPSFLNIGFASTMGPMYFWDRITNTVSYSQLLFCKHIFIKNLVSKILELIMVSNQEWFLIQRRL